MKTAGRTQRIFVFIAFSVIGFFQAADGANGTFAGNFVFQGDSITQGYGSSSLNFCYTGDVSTDPITALGTVYACGVGGARANPAAYFPSGVTTTVTPTSTTTGTTGPSTGLTGTMCVGGKGIPPGTTATLSGTTVTFSQLITATVGTPEAMYFCTEEADYYSYPGGNPTSINTAPRLLSPLVSGTPGYFFVEYGTNDALGTYGTATLSTGSNVATGCSAPDVNAGNFFFSPGIDIGATITAFSGSSGNYTVTFSGHASTVAGSQNVAIMEPAQFTTYQNNMAAIINQGLADNYSQVFVLTIPPLYNGFGVPSNPAKILFNNWIKSTYGNGAMPRVSVVDIASAPELQTTNPNYLSYYSEDLIHPSNLGYQVWARYVIAAISAVSAGADTGSPTVPAWGLVALAVLLLGVAARSISRAARLS